MSRVLCFCLCVVVGLYVSEVFGFRDPFKPVSSSTIKTMKLNKFKREGRLGMIIKLVGIVWDETSPSAVLVYDGEKHVLEEGGRVGSVYMVTIFEDEVVLEYQKQTFRLRVGDVKKL